MKLSLGEAVAYALMVGFGEAFFVADGVRLGGTPFQIGLLVALPLALGSLGSALALGALSRFERRKPIVLVALGVQILLLELLSVSDFLRLLTPLRLIGAAILYQVVAQAAGTAWASWYGDVVPRALRGRYFAKRNRGATLATCLAVIAAGSLLHWLEPGAAGEVRAGAGGTGYGVVFGMAGVFRMASFAMLALAPEPRMERLPTTREAFGIAVSKSGKILRRLVMVTVLLHLVVYVAAPFFGPFMLEELRLSYPAYTGATVVAMLAKFVVLPASGRAVDRFGARAVYLLALMLVALIPIPWIFAEGVGLAVVAQTIAGVAWGTYEIAQFTLLLDAAEAKVRPHLFAVLGALSGGAQVLGTLIGGLLLTQLGFGFRTLFTITMLARLGLALAVPPLVPVLPGRPHIGRRRLLLRMLGVRPSGGLAHRPLPADDRERS